MTESFWHLPQPGPGRLYQQAKDLVINEAYDKADVFIENIVNSLRSFLQLETCVRFLLDGPKINPTTTNITVPFEGDSDRIYHNLAHIIYQQMWGYYLSADPKTTHHGITMLVWEGHENSMVRRETEKFLELMEMRHELAGRVMRDYHMACEMPPFTRDTYLRDTTAKVMDIHLGVRLFTFGEGVERKTVFMPISAGVEAVDRIYYNLEHIIHQNLISYDEIHDHYLPVSEELVLRELESLLVRARLKGNTRKKVINGLKFHTVLLEDPSLIHHLSLADLYYDKLNRIDLLEEASQRSREMFANALIRSTELTQDAGVNVNELKLEDRVYIERPETRETVPAGAPGAPEGAEEGESAPQTDGLKEL